LSSNLRFSSVNFLHALDYFFSLLLFYISVIVHTFSQFPMRTTVKKSITLSDVAKTAGVTSMTVSRVVNQTGYVSEETREKVLRVVKELNYRRNGLARSLKRQRTDTIGLVLGDIANPFATELARAVRDVAIQRGYNLFICISEHSAKEDVAAFDALADHQVDGIIVATRSNRVGDEHLTEMIERGISVVCIGRDFHHENADSVTADALRGGSQATQHLIDLGHQKIAFIGATLSNGKNLKRLQGYLKALETTGLAIEERFITGNIEASEEAPGYSTEKLGYEAMKRLLVLPNRPTAVFARNDFTAIGAINAIKENGLSIPQDISLVGFDDIPTAIHTSPALTTVRQPTRRQGSLAAEFLLRRIENKATIEREEKILECELIVRDSTAAPPRT
jgi:DNA-binding LacI/PurR family transcriptional regulator